MKGTGNRQRATGSALFHCLLLVACCPLPGSLLPACGGDNAAIGSAAPSASAASSAGASAPACKAACERLFELAQADIEKSVSQMPSAMADLGTSLREKAAESRESDLATCNAKCEAGRVDTACVMAAKTIDGASGCTKAAGAPGGKSPDDPPPPRGEADWPSAPTKTVEAKAGQVAFTIEIPAELKPQPEQLYEGEVGWDFPTEPFSQPRFSVMPVDAFPKTVDEGVEIVDPPGKAEIVDKGLDGDRFFVVYRNKDKTYVVGSVLVRAGKGALLCKGQHSSARGLTRFEELGKWFVKLCSTTKPK
jgi:hypothetical protein